MKMYSFMSSHLLKQVLVTLTSSMMSLCCGLTFGISAVLLPQLREETDMKYEESDESWIASIAAVSMVIGALCVGTILDVCGRKIAHILLCTPYIVGWFFIAFANSSTYILIGRFITGLSTGANRPLTLVYIGEIADPKYRSIALFVPGLLTHIGVAISHLLGNYLNWRTASWMSVIPAVLAMLMFLMLKESPLWLISKGRTEEGIESFRWFRGTSDSAEKELATILDRQAVKSSNSIKDTLDVVLSKSFIKPFLVLVVLMMCVQMSGVNVLNFYCLDIFQSTFLGSIDAFAMMMVMDCIRAFVSVSMCVMGKILPRRNAFLSFGIGVTLNLAVLILWLLFSERNYVWVAVLSLTIYLGCSSGIVTVGWSFVPEVMPTKVRGIGSGLTTGISYIILFIGAKVTPDLIKYYGVIALYGSFAVLTFVATTLLCFLLPETNGKTLQSIEDSYKNPNSTENSKL